MKKIKFRTSIFLAILVVSIFITSCNHKVPEKNPETNQTDLATLEKEIEVRLREYESYLKNGDSIALGNMYTEDAEIIPSTIGRNNITKAFGNMIRDSITGSSFKTTKIWGNAQLLVEEGAGTWYHTNGTAVGSGRYLLVWKKDDGKWKILRDTWFPDKKK
ncbi:YybH family protein [Yeosuana marina]|uniref:YybH family protein n=1 Tax=Yeosuana marina TaxID=1565536 RepID=UPI0030C7E904|tara:strand:+ start:2629 stop:3111 length:483 start_codon:yes stop_codon:yes gene_type:complete